MIVLPLHYLEPCFRLIRKIAKDLFLFSPSNSNQKTDKVDNEVQKYIFGIPNFWNV
jgi:hypothetical protein